MSFDEAFKSVIVSREAKLTLRQNHLHIAQAGNEADLFLKDLAFIILESPQITLTSALLSALADARVLLLSCDEAHLPNGVFMPFLAHFQSTQVARAQLAATPQKRAILWQKIVKNKIANQACVLRQNDHAREAAELDALAKSVRLNDANFAESHAAALYFRTLFGEGFTRDELCFENSALNYGYAIVRAAIVRAVCISGLLAWNGIKHCNVYNQFNLADDLIEPFRAFVDGCVTQMLRQDPAPPDDFLAPAHKRALIQNLQTPVLINRQKLPLIRAANHFVQSFKSALIEGGELYEIAFA